MTEDGAQVRAARREARTEPVVIELGSESFICEPEMPLDIVLAFDVLQVVSDREVKVWTVAHLLTDCPCDTSCADSQQPYPDRACSAEKALRDRLRKIRVDGQRLSRDAYDEFYDQILALYAVSEGESETSAGSPASAGERSSGTPSGQVLTLSSSGDGAVGELAG